MSFQDENCSRELVKHSEYDAEKLSASIEREDILDFDDFMEA